MLYPWYASVTGIRLDASFLAPAPIDDAGCRLGKPIKTLPASSLAISFAFNTSLRNGSYCSVR